MDRRTVLGALGASLVPLPAYGAPVGVARLAALEHAAGGRLGVMVRDCTTGRGFGWRQDERFAMCSTFKLSLAAQLLAQIDAGRVRGDEIAAYSLLDVLPASPVTGAAAGQGGLPLLTLAAAAVERSDNLAANLLLARLGGPPALTAFWRAIGDGSSRLDNPEPALNHVLPGAEHDTTTPAAMAATVARLVAGPVLSGQARVYLWGWMKAAATGLNRLRAGLPAGWQGGDKTGTFTDPHEPARINDVAVALPPVDHPHFRAPLAIAAYYDPPGARDAARPADEAVLAAVARIATDPRAWRVRHR